jgi:hypothetical protein
LAEYVQKPKEKMGENYRTTHYNDPVPRLPPAMMGYYHYVPEIYIGARNQKTVALADILLVDESATTKGNEQFTVLDVEAHRWYLNAISACYVTDTASNESARGNDLATNWASTMIGLMGNNSGFILLGATAANTAAASAMAGLIAGLSASAANSLMDIIPGGFLVKPFLPKPGPTGGLTAAGMYGLLSSLELLFLQAAAGAKPPSSKLIIDTEP